LQNKFPVKVDSHSGQISIAKKCIPTNSVSTNFLISYYIYDLMSSLKEQSKCPCFDFFLKKDSIFIDFYKQACFFLDKWPQTKCKITFGTSFWYSFLFKRIRLHWAHNATFKCDGLWYTSTLSKFSWICAYTSVISESQKTMFDHAFCLGLHTEKTSSVSMRCLRGIYVWSFYW